MVEAPAERTATPSRNALAARTARALALSIGATESASENSPRGDRRSCGPSLRRRLERVAEVNATPDAHLLMLFGHLSEAGELARQAGVGDVGRDETFGPIPEHGFEDASRRAGIDAGLRRILRMHWRCVERQPARVALGRLVAVLVAIADRRDRPPEIVLELRVPIDDKAIGESHRKQPEQAGVLGERKPSARRDLRGGLEPRRAQIGL